ncbi:hypothetical protein MsAg5_07620 [Methanosarcinaceae archaeon Ag5]|uniref:GLUG domain-containing protein n=1 Tax=Methanolapillus africanus TaxID=3028297 RepID=A0AAE4MJ40_9EURY|nr:hypothetical protein [Methanosarcinaceae archaeon Ag5]
MNEKQKKTYLIGAAAILILLFLLLLFAGIYDGDDPVQPNTTNNSSGPGSATPAGNDTNNNQNNSSDPESKNNTIYVSQDGGSGSGGSKSSVKIYTVEDLYNVRNNLNGNYIVMNDLSFNDPECYDFSNQDVWNQTAYQWLLVCNEIASSTSFENLTPADWQKVDWAAVKGTDGSWNGESEYITFFRNNWTPIGYPSLLDMVGSDDPIGLSFKNAFTGSFNGNGKMIDFGSYPLPVGSSGASFSRPRDAGGLFNIIGKTGSVSDVMLMNSNTFSRLIGAGELANINMGTVSSCSISYSAGGVSESSDYAKGGLVGINSGTIRDSYVYGRSFQAKEGMGGIVGVNVNISESQFDAIKSAIDEITENADLFEDLISKGYFSGPAVIQNCTVFNSRIQGTMAVGGIAGLNAGGIVRESSVMNTAVFGDLDDGGMIGGITGLSYSGTVTDCYFRAEYLPDGSDGNIIGLRNVGGIAGRIDNTSITNCYVMGVICGNETNVGGIVGRVEGGESFVKNNIFTNGGVVLQEKGIEPSGRQIGRIVGFIKGDEAKNNYSDSQNYAYELMSVYSRGNPESYSGTGKMFTELYTESTYTTEIPEEWTSWDFNNIWKMDAGPYGLPIFQWQENSLSMLWVVDNLTLEVDDVGVSVNSSDSEILIHPNNSVEIKINDYPAQSGFWMYNLSTAQPYDFIFFIGPSAFNAHLDETGYLVFDDLEIDIGSVNVTATDIRLKEHPMTVEFGLFFDGLIGLNVTRNPDGSNDSISIDNVHDFIDSIDLYLYDNGAWSLPIILDGNVPAGPIEGTWDINESQFLGDYTFRMDGGDGNEYNARIVHVFGARYLIIEPGFNLDIGSDHIVVHEAVFIPEPLDDN